MGSGGNPERAARVSMPSVQVVDSQRVGGGRRRASQPTVRTASPKAAAFERDVRRQEGDVQITPRQTPGSRRSGAGDCGAGGVADAAPPSSRAIPRASAAAPARPGPRRAQRPARSLRGRRIVKSLSRDLRRASAAEPLGGCVGVAASDAARGVGSAEPALRGAFENGKSFCNGPRSGDCT
jgi:hypothetical protein